MSEDLFRFDDAKYQVFLDNVSEVRDTGSSSGNTHWKADPSNVFRGAYFGQARSGQSVEYWIETQSKPEKSRKKPSDFSKDSVMKVKSVAQFSHWDLDRAVFQLRYLSFSEQFYLYCQENTAQPEAKDSRALRPLACFYLAASDCSRLHFPLTDQDLNEVTKNSIHRVKEVLEDKFFANGRWAEINDFFRGNETSAPGYTEAPPADYVSQRDRGLFRDACTVLQTPSITP